MFGKFYRKKSTTQYLKYVVLCCVINQEFSILTDINTCTDEHSISFLFITKAPYWSLSYFIILLNINNIPIGIFASCLGGDHHLQYSLYIKTNETVYLEYKINKLIITCKNHSKIYRGQGLIILGGSLLFQQLCSLKLR